MSSKEKIEVFLEIESEWKRIKLHKAMIIVFNFLIYIINPLQWMMLNIKKSKETMKFRLKLFRNGCSFFSFLLLKPTSIKFWVCILFLRFIQSNYFKLVAELWSMSYNIDGFAKLWLLNNFSLFWSSANIGDDKLTGAFL